MTSTPWRAPRMPRVRAVAFDMDGVITQSMERHYEAYRHVFADRGVAIAPREVYAREGQKAPEVVRFIARDRGLAIDETEIDGMARRKQEIFYSFGPLPLYPGAAELVRDLRRAGAPAALVTGTWRANAEQHLGALLHDFAVVVAADEVARTKPDPEGYLRAFEAVGVPPREGVVVENAVLGVRAGKAAGATVVAVTTTLDAAELHEADVVLPDLAAVRDYLRSAGLIA